MTGPLWVEPAVVLAIHEEQLAEHGGPMGVRDLGLLESALVRPKNRHAYGEADLCALAACYADGILRNHPFVDGNKRTAFVVCELFLALNGLEITAADADCVGVIRAAAAKEVDEAGLASWLRGNTA